MAARLRIGSIAKAFAGHLLASLAADGRERLADLGCEVPADLKLPETGGRQADNAGQPNDSWQDFRF
jgi:hypothetical protein